MINENAKQLGQLGGQATKNKYGSGYYQKISKLGNDAKRRKRIAILKQNISEARKV